jgi:hypothetical protein
MFKSGISVNRMLKLALATPWPRGFLEKVEKNFPVNIVMLRKDH